MSRSLEQYFPSPILEPKLDRKARIAIRGVFGQLGARLNSAIGKQPDMEVTIGIINDGPSVKLRGFAVQEANPSMSFYTFNQSNIEGLAKKGVKAEQWNEEKLQDVDLIIDTTSAGEGSEFAGDVAQKGSAILVQSGELGIGRVIIPPKIEKRQAAIFETGDCNANAIIPVVSALGEIVDRVGIQVLMQKKHPINSSIRDDAFISTYFSPTKPLQKQMEAILPEFDISVGSLITQVPGLRYYTHNYRINTKVPVDLEEVISLLNDHPRIRCLPDVQSTFEVVEFDNVLRASGIRRLPPIVPINVKRISAQDKHSIEMVVAVDSRRITVLPNIDSARILLWGVEPIESMKITDQTMNFVSQS